MTKISTHAIIKSSKERRTKKMMRRETMEKIEKARKEGQGRRWMDWREAPVAWATMKKYPEIFEVKREYWQYQDECEEWGEEMKLWRFR